MNYYGDIKLGKTLTFLFTATDATGAVSAIAGSLDAKVYKNDDASEIEAGASIANFDSNTGLYLVTIVATLANGFAAGADYTVVVKAGTIGSIDITDYVIGSFSIENRNGTYANPAMPIGEATNISDMVVQLWSRFFKKVVKDKTDNEIRILDTDNTILSNQNYFESATLDYVDEIGTGSES